MSDLNKQTHELSAFLKTKSELQKQQHETEAVARRKVNDQRHASLNSAIKQTVEMFRSKDTTDTNSNPDCASAPNQLSTYVTLNMGGDAFDTLSKDWEDSVVHDYVASPEYKTRMETYNKMSRKQLRGVVDDLEGLVFGLTGAPAQIQNGFAKQLAAAITKEDEASKALTRSRDAALSRAATSLIGKH